MLVALSSISTSNGHTSSISRRFSPIARRCRLTLPIPELVRPSLLLKRWPPPFRFEGQRTKPATPHQLPPCHQAPVPHHRGPCNPFRVIAREIERHPRDIVA